MNGIIRTKVTFQGEVLDVTLHGNYYRGEDGRSQGPKAILARLPFGEPLGILTVNVVDHFPAPGEVYVKTWSENSEWAPSLLTTGLFEDTGRRIHTGFVEAQVWKYSDEVASLW